MESTTFYPDRYFYTFGAHEASKRICSGDSLTVVCADSDNHLADGSMLPNDRRQVSTGSDLFEGNPIAGPISVEGAIPGDCLAVDILDIELDRDWGQTLLAPGHGLLSCDQLTSPGERVSEAVPWHMYRWQLDRKRDVARLENALASDPVEVPLRPMVGTIGICPPWGQQISTLLAGTHGGNMDLPLIRPGATLLMPVFQEGGFLALGDIHAAQGHGEIVGGGIETSGKVNIRVRTMKSVSVDTPKVLNDSHVYAVATHGDLRQAVELAYSGLVHLLTSAPFESNRWDLYQLISQVGVLEVGGIVIPSCCTVAAGIEHEYLPSRSQAIINEWKSMNDCSTS